MHTFTLDPLRQNDLQAIADRLGVSQEMALEIAINRVYLQLFPLLEGDLADVDFSQSLSPEAIGPTAISTSLPGCEND